MTKPRCTATWKSASSAAPPWNVWRAGRLCREAASLLAKDELDGDLPAYPFAGGDEWSDVDFTVEHLEPTDEPNVLGRLGGYDVLEIIGRGGMGVVLKAFDRELKRCVAIKVLSPQLAQSSLARKRFAREAQAAAAVVHPNVLAIHQVQPNGRLPFLVMPLVAGESLAQRLAARGRLELKEVLRVGMQVAAGLAAAHEQGLVHRDVKPANILLEKGIERAVITDFGLARAADDVALTRWGIIAGTPQYMSPEQARGEALDGRSDLFSLGCVLYEMATGVSPFRSDSTMATMRRLVDDPPQAMASLNPELPPWFIAIVDRLLEKDPSRRFGSAKEVSDLLEGCLAHVQQPANVPLPARKVAGTLRVPSARSKRVFLLFKGVLVMIAFLGIAFLGMILTADPPSIAGHWTGEDWGQVVLKKTNDAEYTGTYTETVGKQPGEIQLKWSRIERRFNGTWREGDDRFGDISIHPVGDEIRGALTTDATSKINPATPRLADLTWVRAKAAAVDKADSERDPLSAGIRFLAEKQRERVGPPEVIAATIQTQVGQQLKEAGAGYDELTVVVAEQRTDGTPFAVHYRGLRNFKAADGTSFQNANGEFIMTCIGGGQWQGSLAGTRFTVSVGKVDKIDLPFVNDPEVLGQWKSVDFVATPSQFNPARPNWKGELYLKGLTFLPGGKTPWPWSTWTKGVVIHHGDQTASHYEIKEIQGQRYMFFEWKSGDVTILGRKPMYYVLRWSGIPPHAHALQFDGTRYATLPKSLKFTSGDFTISLWFNPTIAKKSQALFMRGYPYREQQGDIVFRINPDSGDLDFQARTADSQWLFGWDIPESKLQSAFNLNQWNHVVVTRCGDSYTMWMNGVKVGNEFSSADISDADDTNPLLLGGSHVGINGPGGPNDPVLNNLGIDSSFHGALDEFRIFHRCLSDGEIAALYNHGDGLDGSPAQAPADGGLVTGYEFHQSPAEAATAPHAHALHFDGRAGSYVTIPNLDMDHLTFTTWVKRDVIAKKQYMIMSARDGGWGVYFSETTGSPIPVGENNYVWFTLRARTVGTPTRKSPTRNGISSQSRSTSIS